MVQQGGDERIHRAKAEVARRLRYVRRHHPEGPFTLAGLAERAGVSKRTLSHAESADGCNLTLETLLKVSHSLGISRDAYFLDEQVFEQVNSQLGEPGGPGAPDAPIPAAPVDRLSGLIGEILASAAQAQNALRDLPAPPRGRPGRDDERR
ncbi:helix-turn-helix domain-containing protein [Streptomyces sp. NPDC002536]